MGKKKICIIGVDGGTFDLIKPWIKEGHLPHLEKIMAEGAHGVLNSSTPDNSAPAWTSIVTGKNPGKHKVFSFTSPADDIGKIKIVDSRVRGAESMWDIFSRNERKVCVINVPLTYPPDEVDGIMISGMDTPSTEAEYTTPVALKAELQKEFGRYKIEPESAGTWTLLNEKAKLNYIDEIHEIAKLRCRISKYLLEKNDWDMFMVVFTATDRVQHKFWSDMGDGNGQGSAGENPKISGAIFDTYKLIDSFVGEISDMLSADTTLAIVSDHGFGSRGRKVVSVNRFLSKHNLLRYKEQKSSDLRGKIHLAKGLAFNFIQKTLSPKQRQLLRRIFPFFRGKAFSYLNFGNIDWSQTKVYVDEPMGLVWINRKERFKSGVVNPGKEYEQLQQQIVDLLNGLVDPESGERILRKVETKKDVYSGSFLDEAPDIIFSYENNYSFAENDPSSKLFEGESFLGEVKDIREFLQITGLHRPNGIIILRGNDIRRNVRIEDANVVDVLPICLYLAGLAIPANCDGSIPEGLIDKKFMEENEIRYDDSQDVRGDKADDRGSYSPKEQEEIEDRLKGLGYM